MGNSIELLQHSICLILSVLLIQIATHNQFHQDATKGQICYPKTSMAKYWKLNKRFMVKEDFFDKNIAPENVPNIQCFEDLLVIFRCFWVENVNEEFLKEGAFLEDHVPVPSSTAEITTSQSTPTTTTTSTTSTTPILSDRIQCDGPKWVIVKPAVFYVKRNGRRITADKAIRAGFIDYIYIEKNPPFSEKHINETIMEMIKNSTSLFESNNEVNKWMEDNGGWLQNIKHGYFQYVPLDSKFDDAKLVVAMLLYNCSFGDFILAPAEYNDNFEMAQKKYDWEEDFEFLDKCIERQEDISKKLDRKDRTFYVQTDMYKKLNLFFEVGTRIKPELDLVKCEAFKYKYGYTSPLRSKNLDESSSDSPSRIGALVLPIESSCLTLYGMDMNAEFLGLAKEYLTTITNGLVRYKEDCEMDEDEDCLECLVTEIIVNPDDEDYGGLKQKICQPLVTCTLYQIVYDCNEFSIRIPRVNGIENFTLNGTNFSLDDSVNSYELTYPGYYQKMCTHSSSDHILYDNDNNC